MIKDTLMEKVIKPVFRKTSHVIPDKQYLQLKFRWALGKPLDLNDPKTYSEKLQWLKLYDRKRAYITMVDKYEVKKYVSDIIGEKYIIPTYGVWDSFEDIDFNSLPDRFVLKGTHDGGSIVICKDRSEFDKAAAKKKMERSLSRNYYWHGREWPYKEVKPRIIAEAYMEDTETSELRDYKFFCFDGKVKAMFIATDRQKEGEDIKFDFFDENGKHLDMRQGHPNAPVQPKVPAEFEEMKKLASALSKGFSQLRVDFYVVDGRIYFGELTFFHFDGMVPFEPAEWDEKFGEWIELPKQKTI